MSEVTWWHITRKCNSIMVRKPVTVLVRSVYKISTTWLLLSHHKTAKLLDSERQEIKLYEI